MRHKLTTIAFLAVCSCSSGPWNTEPGGGATTLPRLSVSNLVVAGRPYDTLWLTRSLSLTGSYDSTRTFVDTSASQVRIIRMDGPGAPDTIGYHLATPLAVAWLPDKPGDSAIHGATYRMEAHIRWDAAPGWGQGSPAQWQVADLSATTYTPAVFQQGPILQAPLEALFPRLAGSGFAAFQAFFQDTSKSAQDSLARWSVTQSTMDSLGRGSPVFRPIRKGDTVWYIRSADQVVGLDGNPGKRQDRAYLVPQTLDRKGFGGVLALQRFDSTRAWILDPITQAFMSSLGRHGIDSAKTYLPGQWRIIDFTDAYVGPLTYWPDRAQLKNLDIGFTGWNIFYAYSMDTLYSAHLRGLSGANNILPYTNIHGGIGYFSGAAADSVGLYVKSPTPDTFSVQALRSSFCRNRRSEVLDSAWKAGTDTARSDTSWQNHRPPQCFDLP